MIGKNAAGLKVNRANRENSIRNGASTPNHDSSKPSKRDYRDTIDMKQNRQ